MTAALLKNIILLAAAHENPCICTSIQVIITAAINIATKLIIYKLQLFVNTLIFITYFIIIVFLIITLLFIVFTDY